MRFWALIVGIIPLFFSLDAAAQAQDCEATLTRATEEFQNGHFGEIPLLLDTCMQNGFTREQRQRAYLLLVQTYLIIDDPVSARSSYLSLLQANPEFLTDPARDPIDVVYLSKKFTAAPIFTVFGGAGLNTQFVRVIYSSEIADNELRDYSLVAGFHGSGGVDWNITNNLALTGEIGYSYSSYSRTDRNRWPSTVDPRVNDVLEIKDRQHWLDVPISVRYIDHWGKIRPYGYAGYALNLLIGDIGRFVQINNDNQNNDQGNQNTPNASTINNETAAKNLMPIRTTVNRSFFLGSGVRIKLGLQFAFVDLRYSFGHTNLSNRKYPDELRELWSDLGYVDDYFRLDRLSFTMGYMWPLYKPRELEKARTKGLLRNIVKQHE